MKIRSLVVMATGALLLSGAPAFAQSAGASDPPVTTGNFIKKASQDGLVEVQLASLAQQKAASDDVKKFAVQMQADHEKANSDLQAIAASKHVSVASGLDQEHQEMVSELTTKSGQAFDAAYASHMVAAHKKAVALFTSASHSSDPQIAEFASKTLPTLEHHKGMADDLLAKRKLAAAGAPGATT